MISFGFMVSFGQDNTKRNLFHPVGVMAGATLVGATLGDGLGTGHLQGAALGADLAGRFGFNDILALGIIGATVENAETASLLDHRAFGADGAVYSSVTRTALAAGLVFLKVFAFRITTAGDKLAEPPFAFNQFGAAVGAEFTGFGRALEFLAFQSERAVALGKTGATVEFAVFGQFDDHR